MAVFEFDVESPVGQNLVDHALKGEDLFLGHLKRQAASRLTAETLPSRPVSSS